MSQPGDKAADSVDRDSKNDHIQEIGASTECAINEDCFNRFLFAESLA
jgi:hypothetical protein